LSSHVLLLLAKKTKPLNLIGTLGALLICFVWLTFLRRLDIFERERWRYTLLATSLGAFSTLVLLVVISLPPIRDLKENGEPMHDLLFYIFRVGLLEELAKFLPLLIMVRYTKEVNEPYDFLKYAMCSALGFATLENMLYFNEHGAPIIDKRAYISVVGHLAFTCCAAYGYIRQHYLHRGFFALNFFLFGGLGVLLHGLFDFSLTTEWLGLLFRIGFLFLAYFLVILLRNLITISLNFSPWFSDSKVPEVEKAFLGLLLGLIAVFIYATIGVYLESGLESAVNFVQSNLLLSGTIIFFLPLKFSRLKLMAGKRVNLFQRKH
jgi:RsiW-degrading membrane proteinase PrsW (M82 family)